MSDDAKREAFEAWVSDEYGPDDSVHWEDEAGLPDPPFVYQDGRVALLGDVWESWLSAHAAGFAAGVVAAAESCREYAERNTFRGGGLGGHVVEVARTIGGKIRALAPDTTPATRGRDKENR